MDRIRTIPWPSPDVPLYEVAVELGEVQGRMECVGVTVRAKAPGRVVSGTTLRELALGRLVAEALRELQGLYLTAEIGEGEIMNAGDLSAERLRARAEFWAATRRDAERLLPVIARSGALAKGRRYPPDHLQHVAAAYTEAARLRRDPTAAVGEAYGVTRSAAAKWVARARQRGLLAPAGPRVSVVSTKAHETGPRREEP